MRQALFGLSTGVCNSKGRCCRTLGAAVLASVIVNAFKSMSNFVIGVNFGFVFVTCQHSAIHMLVSLMRAQAYLHSHCSNNANVNFDSMHPHNTTLTTCILLT